RASPQTPVCYRMDNITMTPSQRLLESKSRECSRSGGRWRGQLRGYPSFSRYVRDACIWVALPLTVVKRTCNENGDPDILLLARFHAQPGGAWHGSHDGILPPSALPCQRPNWPGQYRYPFAEGAALHLSRVSQNLQRPQRDGLLSAAHLGRDRG